ncbi:hypothetical protein D3C72_2288930 [compost metagenome]
MIMNRRSIVQNQSATGPLSTRLTISVASLGHVDQHRHSVEGRDVADEGITSNFEVLILIEACASR